MSILYSEVVVNIFGFFHFIAYLCLYYNKSNISIQKSLDDNEKVSDYLSSDVHN